MYQGHDPTGVRVSYQACISDESLLVAGFTCTWTDSGVESQMQPSSSRCMVPKLQSVSSYAPSGL